MPIFRRDFLTASSTSSSGLSRTEILVLLSLLVVLAGVSFAALSRYWEQAKITRAVENARTLATLLSQFATDNNGVYPVGQGTTTPGKSEGIARNLLENSYTPDAAIFALGSTAKYSGTAPDFSDFAAANISWDFTGGMNVTTGITSAASDYLPVIYTTGEVVDYASANGHGLVLSPSGNGPFGHEGIVAAYKGGNALFIPAKPDKNEIPRAFILSNFKDTGTYTQIMP